MVLTVSFEFSRRFNTDIIERPSDDREVPMVREAAVMCARTRGLCR
jgi:hypothetical protein